MTDDKKVKKLGMKDIQREGWEYELTVSLSIDRDTHTAIASKDRTELFEGIDPFVITEATGQLIKDWCEKGIEVVDPVKAAETALRACANFADLASAYTALSPELKTATVKLKDELKAKLKPEPGTV